MEVEFGEVVWAEWKGRRTKKGSFSFSCGECYLLGFNGGRRTCKSNWERTGGESGMSSTKSSGEEREEKRLKNIY